jgi:hypothetical protein
MNAWRISSATVLPKGLEQEYERRLEEDELSAPSLLVPITHGQFFAIKPTRKGFTWLAEPPLLQTIFPAVSPLREAPEKLWAGPIC